MNAVFIIIRLYDVLLVAVPVCHYAGYEAQTM